MKVSRIACSVLALIAPLSALMAADPSLSGATVNMSVRGAELVPSGSRLYDAIDYLAVLSGETTLLVRTPASINEIIGTLDSLGRERTPNGELDALEANIRERLLPSAPLIDTGTGSGRAMLFVHPSVTLGASVPVDGSALLPADLLRVSNQTKPAINVPLAIDFGEWIACRSEFTVGKGYWASVEEGAWTNVPLTASETDMNVPSDAWLAAGNESVTLAVGRGPVSMGQTLSGSMIFSDTYDRPDWAFLTFHAPAIRLSLMPIELSPNRYLYFHGLSLKPFKNLSISLSEAASVNAGIDLRYLNPVMIYHDYAGWRDGSSYGIDGSSPVGTQFGASVEWVPAAGVKVYGQYAMNQFQTGYELSEYSDTASYIPNSLGGLVGAEWIRPAGEGFLVVGAEGLYSNPWLYVLENRSISYLWSRRELVAPGGHTADWIYGWTGNPYGPDTISATVDVAYDIPFKRRIGFAWRMVVQGDNGTKFLENLEDSTTGEWYPTTLELATIATPSGKALTQHSLLLTAAASITESLEADCDLGYYMLVGDRDPGSFLASLSLTWTLR